MNVSEWERQIRRQIREYGWVVQAVNYGQCTCCASTKRVEEHDSFAYTVGLTDAGLSELYVVWPGEPTEAQAVLNELAQMSLTEELVVGTPYTLSSGQFMVHLLDRAITRERVTAPRRLYQYQFKAALEVVDAYAALRGPAFGR